MKYFIVHIKNIRIIRGLFSEKLVCSKYCIITIKYCPFNDSASGGKFGMLYFMVSFFPSNTMYLLQVVAKFGMMHLVATNVCIVIRTLVKESAHEFIHGKPNSLEQPNIKVIITRHDGISKYISI